MARRPVRPGHGREGVSVRHAAGKLQPLQSSLTSEAAKKWAGSLTDCPCSDPAQLIQWSEVLLTDSLADDPTPTHSSVSIRRVGTV